jgi:hypothetical protein
VASLFSVGIRGISIYIVPVRVKNKGKLVKMVTIYREKENEDPKERRKTTNLEEPTSLA